MGDLADLLPQAENKRDEPPCDAICPKCAGSQWTIRQSVQAHEQRVILDPAGRAACAAWASQASMGMQLAGQLNGPSRLPAEGRRVRRMRTPEESGSMARIVGIVPGSVHNTTTTLPP